MKQKAGWEFYALATVGYIATDIVAWICAKIFLSMNVLPIPNSVPRLLVSLVPNATSENLIITIFVVAYGILSGLYVWLKYKSISKLYRHDLTIHLGLAVLAALIISAIAINL